MERVVHSRTGGRSARVVHDVLDATLEELARDGYADLCVEAVAARAGVAKTTIYRRWPTKGELVSAALRGAREDDEAPIDTGSLRTDLVAILRERVAHVSTPRGRAIARAILGGIEEPEVAAIAKQLRERHPVVPPAVLERAIARGELPRGTDATWLAELLLAPIQMRVVFRGEPVDVRWLRRLVDVVVRGLASATSSPSALRPRTPPRTARRARRPSATRSDRAR